MVLLSFNVVKICIVNGGMKMTEENENKPFYKKNSFWIIILSIFIIVSATTYISNYSVYKGKADQATASQSKDAAKSEKKEIKESTSLVDRYNSIKAGKKGFSKKMVIDLLGNPTSSQQIDTNGKVENLIWNGIDGKNNISIQITFEKNKATAKSIQGLNIDRKKLLTLADFNELKNGDSYNQVLNILGDPDDYSDTNGIKTLTYESDLDEADSSEDALIKVEVSNNKIIDLEQQNLK